MAGAGGVILMAEIWRFSWPGVLKSCQYEMAGASAAVSAGGVIS